MSAVRPVIVCYDGSAESTAALRVAVSLFGDRSLVVVTVWEAGLALVASTPDPFGVGSMSPGPADVIALDEAGRRHAVETVEAGARLARELGATAEPVAVEDQADVPAAIADVADQYDASVVVVGTRGLGGVSGMFGSTSRALLNRGDRSVLVVPPPRDSG